MTKNPFDPVFEEISKLMKFAYDNVHRPVPLEKEIELNKKLDELEKQVLAFKRQNEKMLNEMGISEYKVDTIISDPNEQKNFTPEQQKTLKKAEKLKNEATTAVNDIQKAAEESSAADKNEEKPPIKPASVRSRKGKFRGMGGDEKWKRL